MASVCMTNVDLERYVESLDSTKVIIEKKYENRKNQFIFFCSVPQAIKSFPVTSSSAERFKYCFSSSH